MKTAMILAAGRGDRLRPLTDTLPKALCTVHNIPLIEYHVERLAHAGFERLIINHAYLGGQIRQHLGFGERFGVEICYSPEPPGGLETAGGIVNALSLWDTAELITVNADIYTDFPFASLKRPEKSLAHLVLINKPAYLEQGDFGLSETHHLENSDKRYTFSGIACYHRHFFAKSTPGRYSLTPMLRRSADRQQASGEVYTGKWLDIGTADRLEQANRS
ncbi:MAG: nucleotidyltransferase family protein [Legionellales bacterium]|nr:nucleotidyltransferase family protein [Legionellales bacterium]